jgi:hypothetical protein
MVDNCSDNYHVPTSHLSSARVQTRYLGRPRLSHEDQFASPNKHDCRVAGDSVDRNAMKRIWSVGRARGSTQRQAR